MLGWVVFRAESLGQAFIIFSAMVNIEPLSITQSLQFSPVYGGQVNALQIATLLLAWLLIIVRGLYQRQLERIDYPQIEQRSQLPIRSLSRGSLSRGSLSTGYLSTGYLSTGYAFLLVPVFVLAIFKLSAESYSAFLYFQF